MSSCSSRSLLNTGTYQYIPVHTGTYTYKPVHTSLYELNHILQAHVVDGTLTTFGCVEWESEQFWGVMRARSYPFKLPKRRFHGGNQQVYKLVYTIAYITYTYIPVRTSMYQYLPVHTTTSTYHFIPVCTCMYQYIPVHTGTYQYVLVCTSLCWYILVHTTKN